MRTARMLCLVLLACATGAFARTVEHTEHAGSAHPATHDASGGGKQGKADTHKHAASDQSAHTKSTDAKSDDALRAKPSAKKFSDSVNSNFDKWSGGKDTLTISDMSSQVTNPDYRGQQAAVVAAITARMNGLTIWDAKSLAGINQTLKSRGLPPFSTSKTYDSPVTQVTPYATITLVPVKGSSPQTFTTEVTFTKKQLLAAISRSNSPLYQDYTAALTAINQSTKIDGGYKLYGKGDGMPPLSDIRQWKDGDCYLVSSVGSMLLDNPAALQQMIKPVEGSRDEYIVNFPGHSGPIKVKLTDAEIGMYSHVQGGGAWLAVLSVAEGQVRDPGNTNPTTIIHGGEQTQVMQLLTGKPYQNQELNGSASQSQEIGKMLSSVTNGQTGNGKFMTNLNTPIGVETSAHALIITGYNPKTGMVTIWNPWGSTMAYTPAPGGPTFQMQNGMFNVPLSRLQADGFVKLSIPSSMAASN